MTTGTSPTKDKLPVLLKSPQPDYPAGLLKERISGVVSVKFVVDTQGRVAGIEIHSSPHELLSAAVRQALSIWEFSPGQK